MNHQQLDEKLRKLSSKEIDYRDKNVVPTFYNKLQKINIGNQEVYVFDDNQKLTEDVFIIRHNRFAEVPQHIHTFIEMNYVYSGKCTQIIDNNVVEISQGELCIIDTRVPHSINATS